MNVERHREKQPQRDIDRHRQGYKDTATDTEGHIHRETDRGIGNDTERDRHGHREKQAHRNTDIERHTEKQALT